MCLIAEPTTPPRSASRRAADASPLHQTLVAILPEFTGHRDLRDYLSGYRDHERFAPTDFADRVERHRRQIRAARKTES